MLLACRKRKVPIEALRNAVESLERDLYQQFEDEVPTTEIGERVMRALRELDTVAYVRFASVYREFETVADFNEIIESVRADTPAANLS